MSVRSKLLTYEVTNAAFAWGVMIVLLLVAVERVLSGEFLWAGMAAAMIAVGLIPPVVARRPTAMIAWEVLALAALPALARSFDVLVGPMAYVSVAALALVVAVELDEFTDVEMTPAFAVVFVVVMTMAVAGLWTIARYASDVYLGTSLIGDQNATMWDLVVATGVGTVAGLVFELYVRRFSLSNRITRESWGKTQERVGGDDTTTLIDTAGIDSPSGFLMRVLQLALFGLIGYGAVVRNWGLVVNGLLALPIVFFPTFLEWRYGHDVDPRLSIWITVAAVVHAAGFLGPYDAQSGPLSWYDQAAHAISASFVAGIGYALIVALDQRSTRIRFPDEFRFVFTLCFILAFGVAWEIVEFGVGGLASMVGSDAALVQYGLDDIVFDLAFNTLAAAVVALFGTHYFRDITSVVSGRVLGPRNP